MPARYAFLFLDLHDAGPIWDTRETVEAQYEVRWRLLAQGLYRMPDGNQVQFEELRAEPRDALQAEWKRENPSGQSIPVPTWVDRIRQHLGAHFADPVESVICRYAAGGLTEHPPVFNPEAQTLVQHLNEVGFPVILITDTY